MNPNCRTVHGAEFFLEGYSILIRTSQDCAVVQVSLADVAIFKLLKDW